MISTRQEPATFEALITFYFCDFFQLIAISANAWFVSLATSSTVGTVDAHTKGSRRSPI